MSASIRKVFTFTPVCFFLLISTVHAASGCCSRHGGVAGCNVHAGRAMCEDGTTSATCPCDDSSVPEESNSVPSGTDAASVSVFSDVPTDSPYYEAIEWAHDTGVIQGYSDGTFQPDRTVNRAEFLKIVLVAKGINVSDATGDLGFRDVNESAWYAPFIRYAKTQGFIQGYPDGTFRPEQTVNFVEALKMAYNALDVATSDVGGNWYDRFLQHAKTNGVLFTNDVQVDGNMSRKDVVWIAWKLMTHSGDWQK